MTRLHKLHNEVDQIMSTDSGPRTWKPGTEVQHPDGRMVRIVGGQWRGSMPPHGISNFWDWVPIDKPGGEPIGPQECGYGWEPAEGEADDG